MKLPLFVAELEQALYILKRHSNSNVNSFHKNTDAAKIMYLSFQSFFKIL